MENLFRGEKNKMLKVQSKCNLRSLNALEETFGAIRFSEKLFTEKIEKIYIIVQPMDPSLDSESNINSTNKTALRFDFAFSL